ncbi:hypothetical protein Q8F55_008720 [Vanrija albida]|uniref:LYR motif-containing protein Cup1-like N-terminal domain-containing protein n=1 Tax=Vanrija albida TaxID=181172 RepID=A0ABR3PSJ6_9TREE
MAAPVTPRALYRSYLFHLRWLPDPHVWAQLAPHFKDNLRAAAAAEKLIEEPVDGGAESSASGAARKRVLHLQKRVKKDHVALRAAVAYHPKALERLLQKCYAQRGRVRWELIKNVTLTSPLAPSDWPEEAQRNSKYALERRFPPSTHQPLPGALKPLTYIPPLRIIPDRARIAVPRSEVRREQRRQWEEGWKRARVPLAIPPNDLGVSTGWENLGVVEALRQLAGVGQTPRVPPPPSRGDSAASPPPPPEVVPTRLPTFTALPRSLQAAFPRRPVTGRVPDPYPRPPKRHTRDQPKKWADPMPLTPRVLRRAYGRIWDSSCWIQPPKTEGEAWKVSDYHGAFGGRKPHKATLTWSRASSADLEWL